MNALNRREDRGFSLIELMVVVLIIAILMAIAIPTFLGARNTTNGRVSQANVSTALMEEKIYFTANSQFSTVAATLQAAESSLTWTDWQTASAWTNVKNTVYVEGDAAGNNVILGAYGSDGRCYFAWDQANAAANTSLVGYAIQSPSANGSCASPSGAGVSWYTSFANASSSSSPVAMGSFPGSVSSS